MSILRPSLLGVLLALASAWLPAQDQGAKFESARLDGADLVLTVQVAAGWHIYPVDAAEDNKTTIELKPGPKKVAGEIRQPPKKRHRKVYESGYVEEYDYFDGAVEFRVPLADSGAAGDAVTGAISWSACNEDGCLPIATAEFSVPTKAAAPAAAATTRPAAGATRKLDRPKSAEGQDAGDPLTFVSLVMPERVAAGATFDVVVAVRVKPPWHIYGLKSLGGPEQPTAFSIVAPEGAAAPRFKLAGEPKSDRAPKRHGVGAEAYLYFEGTTTFTVPVVAESGPAAEEAPFHFRVAYQCCTMSGCLPPTEQTFELTMPVDAAGGAAPAAAPEKPAPANPTPEKPISGSSTDPKPTPAPAEPEKPVATAAAPESKPTSEPAPLAARFEPAVIQAGEAVTLVVVTPLPKGLDAAKTPPQVTLADASVFRTEGPATARVVGDALEIRQPLRHGGEAVDGRKSLAGVVALGAATVRFAGELDVSTPLIAFILLAMGFALGSLLTPCVFPLIPVTISYFTKQSERAGGGLFRLGATYAVGIVASFTLIGLVFTIALGKDGASSFAMHPITQLVIGLLFIVFALSLFGAFEIQLPSFVLNWLSSAQGKGGTAGALLMGFLFALTTFTCTAPFVGTLLASAATSGDYFRPVVGMIAFSSVLAAPFFWLSVSPGFAKKLPKAGGWMNEVKVVMGFIELAAALKFLSGFDVEMFTRTVCLLFSVAIFVLCGLYLLGLFRLPHDSPRERTTVTHLMLALLTFVLALHLATGLDGSPTSGFIDGYLPVVERSKNHLLEEQRMVDRLVEELGGAAPAPGKRGESARAKTGLSRAFVDDFPGAVAEAERAGVPVFIDFTGFT
jgi:thiol:disulfide interchange protein DsbD